MTDQPEIGRIEWSCVPFCFQLCHGTSEELVLMLSGIVQKLR